MRIQTLISAVIFFLFIPLTYASDLYFPLLKFDDVALQACKEKESARELIFDYWVEWDRDFGTREVSYRYGTLGNYGVITKVHFDFLGRKKIQIILMCSAVVPGYDRDGTPIQRSRRIHFSVPTNHVGFNKATQEVQFTLDPNVNGNPLSGFMSVGKEYSSPIPRAWWQRS